MPSGTPIANDEAQEYARLYLEEGMGMVAIAEKFNRSVAAVWNNLHKLGIPVRRHRAGARTAKRGRYRSFGMYRHPHFPTWVGMMGRCYDDNFPGYDHYGGRGIGVFGPWHDPRVYIEYVETVLGPKPSPEHTIDRKDNDGSYEPGNIRWATRSEQMLNRNLARSGRNA